jgi:hypothetical protein
MRIRDRKASVWLACAALALLPALVRCGGSSGTDDTNGKAGSSATDGGSPDNGAGGGQDKPGQAGATSGGDTGSGTNCPDGFADCDNNPKTGKNGCEADLESTESCGDCNTVCAFDNATSVCTAGKCVINTCDTGFGDCDDLASTGCETAVDTETNCGECGKKCNGSQNCSGGVCSGIKCPPDTGNCDNNAANGCEPLNTLDDCGMCGKPCALDNATANCDTGTCAVMTCDAGWGNCDKKHATGCEAPLNTPGNCGACGTPCQFDNADSSCETGKCEFIKCLDGYEDCNKDPSDGCERAINTLTDCGACDAACGYTNAKTLCEKNVVSDKFECNFTACDAGWENVTPELTDGCECQDLPTPATIKTCGTAKSLGTLGAGGQFEVNGTIPVPTDSDWFTVNMPASARPWATGIDIKFVVPGTAAAFKFDVQQGCNLGTVTCGDEKTPAAGVKEWEYKDTCVGVSLCRASTGPLSDSPATYNDKPPTVLYIRVYRDGAALSCDSYTLRFTRT